MTARERIDALLDPGSERLEIGGFAGTICIRNRVDVLPAGGRGHGLCIRQAMPGGG